MSQLSDADARRRAAEETGTSFALSAGAGSGKTTVLVARLIQHLVEGVDPAHLAAITFTEKAAAELRQRVRDGLEERLEAAPGEEARRRVEGALTRFGELTLSTIHSFCRDLLQREALVAAWAPDTELADGGGDPLFERVYLEWRVGFDRRFPDVALLLRGGLAPERSLYYDPSIHRAATLLWTHRDLEPVVGGADAVDWGAARAELQALHAAFEELIPRCSDPDACKLLDKASRLTGALERACAMESARAAVLLALEQEVVKVGNVGSQRHWGREGIAAMRAAVQALEPWQARWRRHIGEVTHRVLVSDMRDTLFPALEQARRRHARADFADLLLRSARLLTDHPDARRRLARRYRVILVDEVQDTDPVQAEVAALLTRPTGAEGPWDAEAPRPGALFAVGDPKQSIYRFRRADVETWGQLRDLIARGGETLALSQNFRSVPGIVRWVNHAFADYPDYAPLVPHREPAALDPVVAVHARSKAQEIQAALAHLLDLRAQGAEVVDPDTGARRPMAWRDVMILLPTWWNADDVQDAFTQAGVACTLEGGKRFYQRDEVRLLLDAMRAIEEPDDAESVVSVLRSLFGVTHEELLAHREAGHTWRYTAPGAPDTAVGRASALLRRLHHSRARRSWVDLLDALMTETRANAVWALTPRRWAALANVDKLYAMIRRLELTTRTPGEVVGELEVLSAGDEPELSRLDGDLDAVTVTTIHRAKGREAPVVVILCANRKPPSPDAVVDRRRGAVAVRASASVCPPGWDALAEQEVQQQLLERRRLMYVAATRARDQLVITRTRRSSLLRHDLDRAIPAPRAGHDAIEEVAPGAPVRVRLAEQLPAPPHLAETFPGLDAHVDAALKARPPRELPPAPDHPDLDARRGRLRDAVAQARYRSARWRSVGDLTRRPIATGFGGGVGPDGGTVVHLTMEHLDLTQPTEVLLQRAAPLVDAFATLHGVDADLAARCLQIVRRLLHLDVIDEARRAPERWREVPFSYPDRGVLVAGTIDLCFPTDAARARWKVVDWKSHLPPPGTDLHDQYRRQLAQYAKALLRHLGDHVEVEAVLAGPHPELGQVDLVEPGRRAAHPALSHLYLELVAEDAEPTVGHTPLFPDHPVELEMAWPPVQLGLGLDLADDERERLEAAGWRVAVVDTGRATWAAEAMEAVWGLLGLEETVHVG